MGPRRALVVEDDLSIREALYDALSEQGYELREAGTGVEALDCLRSGWRPHVILLDLMMPVMDGRTFREHQRRVPEWACIPLIVLSASRDADEAAAGMDATAVMKKPVTLQRLLFEVARCCGMGPV